MAETVSAEEFLKFRRLVVKHIKRLDALVGDAFESIAKLEDKEDGLVDEALDRATRAQRAVRRLEKRVAEIENT